MTLERRIDILTTVIRTNERVLQTYKNPSRSVLNKEIADEKELLQLLQELQRWRNLESVIVPHYRDGIRDEYNRGANEMLEEVIDDIRKYIEEVNADG